jgi:hypothetical protein
MIKANSDKGTDPTVRKSTMLTISPGKQTNILLWRKDHAPFFVLKYGKAGKVFETFTKYTAPAIEERDYNPEPRVRPGGLAGEELKAWKAQVEDEKEDLLKACRKARAGDSRDRDKLDPMIFADIELIIGPVSVMKIQADPGYAKAKLDDSPELLLKIVNKIHFGSAAGVVDVVKREELKIAAKDKINALI